MGLRGVVLGLGVIGFGNVVLGFGVGQVWFAGCWVGLLGSVRWDRAWRVGIWGWCVGVGLGGLGFAIYLPGCGFGMTGHKN